MDTSFWFFMAGLALAIPLSISANLLTKKYERWAEKRGIKRSQNRTKSLREEYRRAKWLAARPQRLTEYLLYHTITMVANLSASLMVIVLSTIGPVAYRIRHGTVDLPLRVNVITIVGEALGLFMFIIAGFMISRVRQVYYRVHYFPNYRQSVIKILGSSIDDDKEDADLALTDPVSK